MGSQRIRPRGLGCAFDNVLNRFLNHSGSSSPIDLVTRRKILLWITPADFSNSSTICLTHSGLELATFANQVNHRPVRQKYDRWDELTEERNGWKNGALDELAPL